MYEESVCTYIGGVFEVDVHLSFVLQHLHLLNKRLSWKRKRRSWKFKGHSTNTPLLWVFRFSMSCIGIHINWPHMAGGSWRWNMWVFRSHHTHRLHWSNYTWSVLYTVVCRFDTVQVIRHVGLFQCSANRLFLEPVLVEPSSVSILGCGLDLNLRNVWCLGVRTIIYIFRQTGK